MKKIFEHLKHFGYLYECLFFIILIIGFILLFIFDILLPWCFGGTYQSIEKVEIYENKELIETYTNVENISDYTIHFEDGNKLLINEHCNIKIYYVEICKNPDSKYCPLNGDSNE